MYIKNIEKILFQKIDYEDFNLFEYNNLIKFEKSIPNNFIKDLFYIKFFQFPYSISLYNFFSDINIHELNNVFYQAIQDRVVIKKDIFNKKIIISGKILENGFNFINNATLLTESSPFKSSYFIFGIFFQKDKILDAFLTDAYIDLIVSKELIYSNDNIYRFESEVAPHYFGNIVYIILSGFGKGNNKIIERIKRIIDSKHKLPFEYIKNRALGKIFLKLDYEPQWSEFYSHYSLLSYDVDKIISGIKKSSFLELPKSANMFGILFN